MGTAWKLMRKVYFLFLEIRSFSFMLARGTEKAAI